MSQQIPEWQLPPGVTRGMWQYAHSDVVADDYDDYFALNKLFDFDEQILAHHFKSDDSQQGSLVADLGCGTGRALLPLVRRGFRGMAIDLSKRMLDIVRAKATEEGLPIECVQANLVELDCVDDESVDFAMCLFSTLGMVRKHENRMKVLHHVKRILRPDGKFVLHVHNYWYNLYDPGGPWWLVKNLVQSMFSRDIERGDKYFPYRGVANMFLHVFTRWELTTALKKGGLKICEIVPIDVTRMRSLRWPWFLDRLRANGWIVVCQK